MHHTVEALSKFHQHNLMFRILLIWLVTQFCFYNPSGNFNIYLGSGHHFTTIMQGCHHPARLHKVPQSCDNPATTLQDCGKVARNFIWEYSLNSLCMYVLEMLANCSGVTNKASEEIRNILLCATTPVFSTNV